MKVSDLKNFAGYTVVNVRYTEITPKILCADDEVAIIFDTTSNKYFMVVHGIRHAIVPVSSYDRIELEAQIAVPGLHIKSYICDIDDGGQSVHVYLFRFLQRVVIPGSGRLLIKIKESIREKLPKKVADPVSYLSNAFIYEDRTYGKEVFILRKQNITADEDFALVCGRYRLNIKRIDSEYIAKKIVHFSKTDSPMFIMSGGIEFVDESKDAPISGAIKKIVETISDAGKYTTIWRNYDNLESLLFMRQAISIGVFEYNNYSLDKTAVLTYVFSLKNDQSVKLEDGIELDVTDDDAINSLYLKTDKPSLEEASRLVHNIRGQYIGKFKKIEDGKMYIESDREFASKKVPKHGFIYKSMQGDLKRMRRREQAQERINSQQAPLPGMSILLNDGISLQKSESNHHPITEELKQKLKDARGNSLIFNEAQQEAIAIAINTPDIALIQGPPGSGKTTVIHAITARFEEIYKKNNNGKLPRILITSFQHDAVENAIEKIDTLGLPVNRVGGRREDAEKRRTVINKWIENTAAKLNDEISALSNPSLFNMLDEMRLHYFAWLEKGKDFEEGVGFLRKYSDTDITELSYDLKSKIGLLLQKKTPAVVLEESPESRMIRDLLLQQRTTQSAFANDGLDNLRDLEDMFSFFMPDFILPACFNRVIDSKGSDKEAFADYVSAVSELLEQFAPSIKKNIFSESENLNWCIFELIKQKEKLMLSRLENIDTAKAKILLDYRNCLYSETEDIVRQYAPVQSSTCQQTMETGRAVQTAPFDLVIVDEAARAVPSDLFIPLSLGKKIVLVGDQRQLPHMLDPDTMHELILNTDEEIIKIYTQSLFERLFELLDEVKSSGVRHTCSLTDQYRMISDISNFVRDKIYLPKVNLRCMVTRTPYNIAGYDNKAMVWIEAGKSLGRETKGHSKSRDCEAQIVLDQIRKLLALNIDIGSIGVITFYASQRDLIIQRLDTLGLTDDERHMLAIGTIDAFQGKEFDAVLFSCSRSNDMPADEVHLRQKVGFLNDDNRMCVALSRARNLLIGVGDSSTVQYASILGEYIKECKFGKGSCIIYG